MLAIALLYLGTRGGGSELTKKFAQALRLHGNVRISSIGLSSKNANMDSYTKTGQEIVEVISGTNLKGLCQTIRLIFQPKELLKKLKIDSESFVLIPMVSPFDLPLSWRLRRSGVKIIRVIHDAKKHPGDVWPGHISIRLLINSADLVITLSEFVKSQLPSKDQDKIIVIPHPPFEFAGISTSQTAKSAVFTVLFLGRIRKYKGVNELLRAWQEFVTRPELRLIIAGEGSIQESHADNIQIINHWLSDSEMADLVVKADAVIFPYQEASQSGLIPYVASKNKLIIITPTGGLIEQVDQYKNVIVTKSAHPKDLSLAIAESLNFHVASSISTDYEELWQRSIRTLILKLDELVT